MWGTRLGEGVCCGGCPPSAGEVLEEDGVVRSGIIGIVGTIGGLLDDGDGGGDGGLDVLEGGKNCAVSAVGF